MSGSNLFRRHHAGARYTPRRALNILDGDTGHRSVGDTRGSAMRPEPGSWATARMRPSLLTPPTTGLSPTCLSSCYLLVSWYGSQCCDAIVVRHGWKTQGHGDAHESEHTDTSESEPAHKLVPASVRFHIVNGQNITCYPFCCKLG